ncbi:hypothetical protein [Oceanomicrobium pacificus]|uniref:Uncharacterized protein n=1 Tax=Oceanomicrobium pacificus TaxID=2692916 RepID=A0A6B0TTN1_9RHOB|nr:hypothetical protein [Oceanomicrobium pacificus]MXU64592.1 hypothetical protein [Oceanomicrobium pacificus]
MRQFLAAAILAATGTACLADTVRILDASAKRQGAGWTISVTLEHADTGWDHYADAWRVEAPDGTGLGQRKLLHPHVDEQPFTRSLIGVMVPDGADHLIIRARDTVHGWAEESFRLTLPD